MRQHLNRLYAVQLLTIALITFAPPVWTADDTGQYLIMGLGNSTCNAFLSEDELGAAYYMSWLAGYMTSYNLLQDDTYSILGKTKDAPQVDSWLRDYCMVNSTESFESAVRNLLRNLNYFRKKKKQ